MPDFVEIVGEEELLPGQVFLVYRNARTGKVTKVPKEIMQSPTSGPAMLSHLQGYGSGQPMRDPGQERYDERVKYGVGPVKQAQQAELARTEADTQRQTAIDDRVMQTRRDALLSALHTDRETDMLQRRDRALNALNAPQPNPSLQRRDQMLSALNAPQLALEPEPYSSDMLNAGPRAEMSPGDPGVFDRMLARGAERKMREMALLDDVVRRGKKMK